MLDPLPFSKPASGGRAPRRKGVRAERELVHWHEARGIVARRQPFSGALNERLFKADVLVAGRFRIESKRRGARGYKHLYDLLAKGADMAFVRADGAGWLVLMPLPLYELLCVDELRRLGDEK